jgi:hypothetical protein
MKTYTPKEATSSANMLRSHAAVMVEHSPLTATLMRDSSQQLKAFAALLKSSEDAKAVAMVPVHPTQGPLWMDTYAAGTVIDRSANYPRMALFTHPPADSGEAKDAARYRWLRLHCAFANDSMNEIWFDLHLERGETDALDRQIDAAMSAESREKES